MKNMQRVQLGVHQTWKEPRTGVDSNVSSTAVSASRAGQFIMDEEAFHTVTLGITAGKSFVEVFVQ